MNRYLNFVINALDRRLSMLVFFVTARCNSSCRGCFYWKSLNKGRELRLAEIRRISDGLGRIRALLVSGGEPFLRDDLAEICMQFYNKNKTHVISIPTNGLLTEEIAETALKLLTSCPDLRLTINLSLDGLEETHDYLRGVKGNFNRVMETEKALRSVKAAYPGRLTVNAQTVVSSYNLDEMPRLIEYVRRNMRVDYHSFELMRGDYRDKTLKPLTGKQMKRYIELNLENDNYHLSRHFSQLARRYFLEKKMYFYNMQAKVIKGRKLPLCCLAGRVIGVIEPNGDVRLCELLEPVGNLRKSAYSFRSIWRSRKAREQRQMICKTRCSCTHCVFLYATIEHSPRIALCDLPMRAVKSRGD